MQSTNIRDYQGGPGGASLPRHGAGELSHGAGGRGRDERKGQLLVMIRGWGRWYPVESVRIERMVVSSSR